jgi:hypothetical protein
MKKITAEFIEKNLPLLAARNEKEEKKPERRIDILEAAAKLGLFPPMIAKIIEIRGRKAA